MNCGGLKPVIEHIDSRRGGARDSHTVVAEVVRNDLHAGSASETSVVVPAELDRAVHRFCAGPGEEGAPHRDGRDLDEIVGVVV